MSAAASRRRVASGQRGDHLVRRAGHQPARPAAARRSGGRPPAKINLLLGVGAPRPDGFHTLVTVYQAVSLYDDLTVAPADELTVATEVGGVHRREPPAAPGLNIVDRAAAALAAHHGRPVGCRVRIDKTIPIAGGLAGGSADGAAALVALDRLHGLGTSDDDLLALAAGLGSDVPFALLGGTALGEGHGEIVTPVTTAGPGGGSSCRPPRGCRRRRSTATTTSSGRTRRSCPARPTRSLGALAERRPYAGSPRPCTTTSSRPRCDLRPELAAADRRGRRRRRAARAGVGVRADLRVPVRVRRPCPRRWPAALPRADDQRVVLVAHGPVAGAHVVRVSWMAQPRSTSSGSPRRTACGRCSTDVSLGVSAGERIGVVGRNGDGKTTLLQVLTGQEPPDTAGSRCRAASRSATSTRATRSTTPTRCARPCSAGRPDHEWAAEPRTREVVEELLAGVELDRAVDRAVRRRAPALRAGRAAARASTT